MWKTKLIEVKASEKLPPEKGEYLAVIDEELSFAAIFPFDPGDEEDVHWWKKSVDYWLEEVPDHEDEMREMLEKCYKELLISAEKGNYPESFLQENGGEGLIEISNLLTKLKTHAE